MNKEDLVQVKIPNGEIVVVPRSKLPDYVKRPGHEFVGDYKIVVDKLDALLAEQDKAAEPVEIAQEVEEPKELGKITKKWSWQK